MSGRCHFVTFGGGPGWRDAARRLAAQAEKSAVFHSVHTFTDEDLQTRVPDIIPYWPFIASNHRGFGYWIWKPCLIGAVMDQAEAEDVVFYLDAGFEFMPSNEAPLRGMVDFAREHGAMILDYARCPIFNAIFWTKPDVWEAPEFADLGVTCKPRIPLASAGSICMSVTPRNRQFVATWFSLATRYGCHLVDDTPSARSSHTLFFEHRHDQSIFSLLKATHHLPTYGSALDYDFAKPAYFRAWPELLHLPFLALRTRTGHSMIAAESQRDHGFYNMLRGTAHRFIHRLKWRVASRPKGDTERIGIAMMRRHRRELEKLALL